MKPTAVLINTARGEIVDQRALVRALTEGWIAAAGLDVLDPEPPPADDPILASITWCSHPISPAIPTCSMKDSGNTRSIHCWRWQ